MLLRNEDFVTKNMEFDMAGAAASAAAVAAAAAEAAAAAAAEAAAAIDSFVSFLRGNE